MGTTFISQVIYVIQQGIYECILQLFHPSFLKTESGIEMYIYIKMLRIWLGTNIMRARSGIVVKALRYKLAGRGFDSQWCHWNFSVT